MTAWQDQPPQSRRQLRLNERGLVGEEDAPGARTTDAPREPVDFAEPPVPNQHESNRHVPDQRESNQHVPDQRESNQHVPDQATTSVEAETRRPRSRAEALASGRRSQRGFAHSDAEGAESSGSEPLNYFTQRRSQVPVYGGPSFGVNAVTPPPTDSAEAVVPEAVSGPYRIRDFRPEARRSAFSSTAEQSNVPSGGSLDYYTQQGPGAAADAEHAPTPQPLTREAHAWRSPARESAPDESPAQQPPVVEQSAQADSAAHDAAVPHFDHTMTRRELRALREAAAAKATAPNSSTALNSSPALASSTAPTSATAPTPPAAPASPAVQTPPAAQNLPSAPLWRATESPAAPAASWSLKPESPAVSPAESPAEEQAHLTEPHTPHRFPFAGLTSEAAVLADPVPLRSPKAPAPRSSRELSDAMAEFDALMASGSDSVAESEANDLAGASDEDPALDSFAAAARRLPEKSGDAVAPDEDGPSVGVDVFDSLLGAEPSIETSAEPFNGAAPSKGSEPSNGPEPVWPLAPGPSSAEPSSIAGRAQEASRAETARAAEAEPVTEAPHAAKDTDHRYVAPVGHWSRQAADDGAQDAIDEEPGDAQADAAVALGRSGGATGGAVTANHLVISSVPAASDLLKPFSPTGEIMITGTIDLPRSLGTTGAHPARYDHSDVDTLLEASDREDSNVDSAPVRAIRAVSTHTSSRGLIGSGKPPRSSRLPMILAVSTAAVAAVVVVLFVAGIVLRVF